MKRRCHVPVPKRLVTLTLAVTIALGGAPALANRTTQEKLDDARREIAEQTEKRDNTAKKLSSAQERLATLSEQAGLALEAYDDAVKAADIAIVELREAEQTLAEAKEKYESSMSKLSRWAAKSYRDGSSTDSTWSKFSALADGGMSDYAGREWAMKKAGNDKANLVEEAESARQVADYAQGIALNRQEVASKRQAEAKERKKEADKAVALQRAQVDAVQAELRASQERLIDAENTETKLLNAMRIAEAARQNALSKANNKADVLGPTGSCKGGDVRGYPNGKLPVSLLCPLWGAPGHFLRADASHAFEKMSKAYARETGKPLCVTDSYRNYSTQVSLKQRKPRLAARPGTSNHGWGRAIDFCGGINRFDTDAHKWMRLNAPLYGWYHPQWARINGSKPEAWHWEYSTA